MTAKSDYPDLDVLSRFTGTPMALRGEMIRALEELERLRRWKSEAECVLEEWNQLWQDAGCPGKLGDTQAAGLRKKLLEIEVL